MPPPLRPNIPAGVPQTSIPSLVANGVKILFFVVGVAAVVVIIVGGLLYVVSAGNPDRTKQAKDAVLYAVIGLVVAGLAFAIVTYITGQFGIT